MDDKTATGDTSMVAHGPVESMEQDATETGRRAYRSPRLEVLGDIRGKTLGGSYTPADSGTTFRGRA